MNKLLFEWILIQGKQKKGRGMGEETLSNFKLIMFIDYVMINWF